MHVFPIGVGVPRDVVGTSGKCYVFKWVMVGVILFILPVLSYGLCLTQFVRLPMQLMKIQSFILLQLKTLVQVLLSSLYELRCSCIVLDQYMNLYDVFFFLQQSILL